MKTLYGIWFGESWKQNRDGSIFQTDNRGLAEATRRQAIERENGDPAMAVMVFGPSGRPLPVTGPGEHKADLRGQTPDGLRANMPPRTEEGGTDA